LKIVIVQGAFLPVPPLLGGAVEKIWFSMGKEFASRGHEVIHISRLYKDTLIEEKLDGVNHIRVKGYQTPSSAVKLKLLDLLYSRRTLKKIPPDADIIITNTFWTPILLRGQAGKKVYVDVQRMPKGQMKLYRHVGKFRANSKPVATSIKEELPANVHTNVSMVPNPLPFSTPPEVNIDKKKKNILFTGRIHPEKGISLLIEAFKLLEPGWRLQIIGPWQIESGGGGDTHLNFLKELAKGYPIEFIPPIYNTAALNEYYRSASVFVYPSLAEKGETFGLAALEAMAFGCIPIVSELKCFQDFIVNGRNGLIFNHRAERPHLELKKKIDMLTENATLRLSLTKEAIKVNESHSISTIASEFLKDFDSLLQ
jgi:glycosyltransferase involved in cell wall biosynthesis